MPEFSARCNFESSSSLRPHPTAFRYFLEALARRLDCVSRLARR
jgi:hypothetical protein